MTINERFARFARGCSNTLGSPVVFVVNCIFILLWLVMGPVFGYSDTWQLLVNTVTTVLTYLAVFLLQNTQNRDSKAMHLKLDELIRSIKGARNHMLDLDEFSDTELQQLEQQFRELGKLDSKQCNAKRVQNTISKKPRSRNPNFSRD